MKPEEEIAPAVREMLLDSLVREIQQVEILRDDDVTVDRLIERTGVNRNLAERMLNDKVRHGELVKVSCYNQTTGRRTNAYRLNIV